MIQSSQDLQPLLQWAHLRFSCGQSCAYWLHLMYGSVILMHTYRPKFTYVLLFWPAYIHDDVEISLRTILDANWSWLSLQNYLCTEHWSRFMKIDWNRSTHADLNLQIPEEGDGPDQVSLSMNPEATSSQPIESAPEGLQTLLPDGTSQWRDVEPWPILYPPTLPEYQRHTWRHNLDCKCEAISTTAQFKFTSWI